MKLLTVSIATAIALSAVVTRAEAQPVALAVAPARLDFSLYAPADPVALQRAQFLFGGHNYCWYPGGWHGPGWYWCGYAYRRGFGWGGPVGWHGWVYHRPVVGYRGGYHGPYRGGYHGAYHAGGYHGGGAYHGGGHAGGGHPGGGAHHR